MSSKDPRIDAYISTAAPFARPILKHLRKLVHTACPEVEETTKWSMPHFDYRGMMCAMAAFKQHCTFGFWKASLIFGSDQAERDAMGNFGRITTISDLPAENVLLGYIRKAMKLNEEGTKNPERSKPRAKSEPLEVPSYFQSALHNNAKARKTFDAFPPGQRREYVEWVGEAKREVTRASRLATSMQWLAEGRRRNWKYQSAKAS